MIDEFRGEYYFLSNFSESKIVINGITFINGESAFQSFKEIERQSEFANLEPFIAKRRGKNVELRNDWEDIKDGIMYQVVKLKFEQNNDLKEKLIATKDEYIEEGNTWNDTYWGVCRGQGKNILGEILMRVRLELRNS